MRRSTRPSSRPSSRPGSRPGSRPAVAIATGVIATVLLAGCAASAPSVGLVQTTEIGQSGDAIAGLDSTGLDSTGLTGTGLTDTGLTDGTTAAADRSVITTGWVTVLVAEPADAADAAIGIVDGAGGRIDGRSERAATEYDGGSATLTLRIPADRLTAVLDELQGLGDLQELSLSASDVTLQVQDLDARITAMRASVERLQDLIAQASDVDALIALETAISDRQAQLESMLAEQRWTDDQVAMSTVTLQLVTQPVAATPAPGTFVDGLLAGWAAFVGFLAGLLVAAGFALPWLVALGLIGLIVVLAVHRGQRRARRTDATGERQQATADDPVTPAGPAAP